MVFGSLGELIKSGHSSMSFCCKLHAHIDRSNLTKLACAAEFAMDADEDPIEYDPAYLNSLRELKVLAVFGLLALIYTIGYASFFGYSRPVLDKPRLMLGMPLWVFWGVVVPWIGTAVLTVGFALFVIRDDDDDLVELKCNALDSEGDEA